MSLPEINQKVESLLGSWEEFKIINDQRLNEIEKFTYTKSGTDEQLTKINDFIDQQQKRIEDLELSTSRPGLARNNESSQEYKSFSNYVKHGQKDTNDFTLKGGMYQTGVETTTYLKVLNLMTEKSLLRKLSSVYKVKGQMSIFSKATPTTASWTSSGVTTNTASTDTEKVEQYTLYAQTQISQEMIDESYMDVTGWIIKEIAEVFSATESTALFTGDGNGKPIGILHEVESEQKIAFTGTDITFDDVISLYYSLSEEHLSEAVFIANQKTFQTLRKLKTTDGTYIWNPSTTATGQETLLGFPVYRSADVSDKVVIFGNFRQGYALVDFGDIRITRDPFSAKPFVSFYATKRLGFAQQDPDAVKILMSSK